MKEQHSSRSAGMVTYSSAGLSTSVVRSVFAKPECYSNNWIHWTSLFVCLVASSALAQDVQIAQQRGPYYVDDPMVMQIQVSDVARGKEVTCRFGGVASDGLTVTGPQVSQSSSSFTQIINGRITSSESVSYKFNFQVTSRKEGAFDVGPFVVVVDSKEQVIDGAKIEFGSLADDPDMKLEVSMPKEKIYVGERVPVTIRWAFSGDRDSLQHAFSNLQIRSPMFDQFDFSDKEPTTRTTLSISTAQGTVEIDAKVAQERRDGREFVVVTGDRILIAESSGQFDSIPVTCRTQRVTSWSRDFFGEVRPRDAKPALASAEPLSFTVTPLPSAGKPASFSGAVGDGFSIDVAANRSVVRVGDPISLDVTIQGDGNLEKLSLPPLTAGLDEGLFQLPSEIPSGTFTGTTKQFKVNVRVKDKNVNQLPAIPFSWFDPKQEMYLTAHSKPIALQVMEAQVVSANDVVSGAKQSGVSEELPKSDVASLSSASNLRFIGANLAIEKHVPVLLSTAGGTFAQNWIIVAIYFLSVVSIVSAIVIRRRSMESPEVAQQKLAIRQSRKEIQGAQSLSLREAAGQIASGLRRLIAILHAADRALADEVIAQCESLVYAPSETDSATAKKELIARALSAADRLTGKQ